MDCSPPGFSIHGFSRAKILELVTISYSRGSSDPGMEPMSPALSGRSFITARPCLLTTTYLLPYITILFLFNCDTYYNNFSEFLSAVVCFMLEVLSLFVSHIHVHQSIGSYCFCFHKALCFSILKEFNLIYFQYSYVFIHIMFYVLKFTLACRIIYESDIFSKA